jgi:hypothetical protein
MSVRAATPGHPTDRLVGQAPALQALRLQIRQLASFDTLGSATVFLAGQRARAGSYTGTHPEGSRRGDGALGASDQVWGLLPAASAELPSAREQKLVAALALDIT